MNISVVDSQLETYINRMVPDAEKPVEKLEYPSYLFEQTLDELLNRYSYVDIEEPINAQLAEILKRQQKCDELNGFDKEAGDSFKEESEQELKIFTFDVTKTQTSKSTVTVEAYNKDEAEMLASKEIENLDYTLDTNEYEIDLI